MNKERTQAAFFADLLCQQSKTTFRKKIISIFSLLPCLFLTACIGSFGAYDSENIPPDVVTSEITYKNYSVLPVDVTVTPEYSNCRYPVHVVSAKLKAGRELLPGESKTIKFPANTINTSSIDFFTRPLSETTDIQLVD